VRVGVVNLWIDLRRPAPEVSSAELARNAGRPPQHKSTSGLVFPPIWRRIKLLIES
jgi:hypothetical protein